MAENGNIAYISTEFGHRTVAETEISFRGSENGHCQYSCYENWK